MEGKERKNAGWKGRVRSKTLYAGNMTTYLANSTNNVNIQNVTTFLQKKKKSSWGMKFLKILCTTASKHQIFRDKFHKL